MLSCSSLRAVLAAMERDVCAEPREVEAANDVETANDVEAANDVDVAPEVQNEVEALFPPFFEVGLGLFTSEIEEHCGTLRISKRNLVYYCFMQQRNWLHSPSTRTR